MVLRDLIIHKIEKEGPISFRDFMEMALYHPEYGYFTSGDHKIGKKGDFFTSPYISSAFGAMLGRQIEEIRKLTGGDFTIVEYGAGAGLLCLDILQYLKLHSDNFESIKYVIIEKKQALRKINQHYLFEKVKWLDNIEKLGKFEGCVISNELFDNIPFHRILMEDRQLMEIFVDFENDFREILRPAEIQFYEYLASSSINLPNDCCIEVCFDAAEWYKGLSEVLKKGYIITIDYGCLDRELVLQNGGRGTIRSYYRHQIRFNPYDSPGEQDITADVNFSGLNYWGTMNGFEFTGYVNQHRFLRALGLVPFLSNMEDSEENKKFALTTLMNQMGRRFKVLIQRKNLPYHTLQGFGFEDPVEKKMCSAVTF